MLLPKLYSKRSDGGLQEWTIEVQGDGYRTISGMVSGEKITSEWTRCQPKNVGRANETTAESQAAAAAQAKWNKKYDGGYRESADKLGEVDLFEPMLALKYADRRDKLQFPVWVQPKLDGVRCLARPTGLWTRKGKPHRNMEHVRKALVPVFEHYPTLVIDGEAYADKLNNDFNAIISLVKKSEPSVDDRNESADCIRYHVYDCYFADRPDMGFAQRITKLAEIVAGINEIVKVQTRIANNQEEMDRYYAEWLELGYEGQMVRTNTPYEVNKRAAALLKRKEFEDGEFEIADVLEGVGNRAGTAGAVLLTTGDKAGIRGNREWVAALLANRTQLIGKVATIRYQNKTPGGALRFPVLVAIRDYE